MPQPIILISRSVDCVSLILSWGLTSWSYAIGDLDYGKLSSIAVIDRSSFFATRSIISPVFGAIDADASPRESFPRPIRGGS